MPVLLLRFLILVPDSSDRGRWKLQTPHRGPFRNHLAWMRRKEVKYIEWLTKNKIVLANETHSSYFTSTSMLEDFDSGLD